MLAYTERGIIEMSRILYNFRQLFRRFVLSRQFMTIFLFMLLMGGGLINLLNSNKQYENIETAILYLNKHIYTADDKKWMHFSIDDSIEVFEDITDKQYNSIFENKELKELKELHDSYGMVVSLYFFYEKDGFDLSMVTDKYASEFSDNSEWLKVGFHSYDENTNYALEKGEKGNKDYNLVMTELLRITGSSECIDHVPRIHLYAGNEDVIRSWSGAIERPRGYLSADDDRNIYLLNSNQSKYVAQLDYYYDIWNDIYFVPTDIRLEKTDNLGLDLMQKSDNHYVIIFTHEWALDSNMYKKIEECCRWAQEREYLWNYFENTLE